MLRDVNEMERMLDAFLDFARGQGLEEPVPADPAILAQDAVDRAVRGGLAAKLGDVAAGGEAMLRPDALSRALDNLIVNAVRYGGKAVVSVARNESGIQFRVDDPGPGIPPELRAEAQKPFARLDSSRNQDSGSGVGLGLSIAADIAHSHGGSLELEESPDLGGLRAQISIPI